MKRFLVILISLILLTYGCNLKESDKQSASELVPAPDWFQKKAQDYLENKLSKEYVQKNIKFEESFFQKDPEKYVAYFEYNFPYTGYKRFDVIAYNEKDCCFDNGPAKRHTFKITEKEAFEIASKEGMVKKDGVEFLHKNRILVEHIPPNPNSKNEITINNGYGDYILEVYVNEKKKGEISNVYIDSDTGEVLGVYIATQDYKPSDVITVPEIVNAPQFPNQQK